MPKEISDIEQAFYELDKVRQQAKLLFQQIDLLSDFLLSRIKPPDNEVKQNSGQMIDPRTGKPFRSNKSANN